MFFKKIVIIALLAQSAMSCASDPIRSSKDISIQMKSLFNEAISKADSVEAHKTFARGIIAILDSSTVTLDSFLLEKKAERNSLMVDIEKACDIYTISPLVMKMQKNIKECAKHCK